MLARKTAPRTGNPELDRAFQQIYNDLNEIIDVLGKSSTSAAADNVGVPGEARVVKVSDNSYLVYIKTDEGWVRSAAGAFTFQQKT